MLLIDNIKTTSHFESITARDHLIFSVGINATADPKDTMEYNHLQSRHVKKNEVETGFLSNENHSI